MAIDGRGRWYPAGAIRLLTYSQEVISTQNKWLNEGYGPKISPASFRSAVESFENSFEKEAPGEFFPGPSKLVFDRGVKPKSKSSVKSINTAAIKSVNTRVVVADNLTLLYFVYRTVRKIFGDSDERPCVECEQLLSRTITADSITNHRS